MKCSNYNVIIFFFLILFHFGSESDTSKVPKVIGSGKATEILAGASTAAAIASYASYLKFQEEDEIIKEFKRTAFKRSRPGGKDIVTIWIRILQQTWTDPHREAL